MIFFIEAFLIKLHNLFWRYFIIATFNVVNVIPIGCITFANKFLIINVKLMVEIRITSLFFNSLRKLVSRSVSQIAVLK